MQKIDLLSKPFRRSMCCTTLYWFQCSQVEEVWVLVVRKYPYPAILLYFMCILVESIPKRFLKWKTRKPEGAEVGKSFFRFLSREDRQVISTIAKPPQFWNCRV